MTATYAFLANHLWQSTLFAAGAWLLTLALRNGRASVRHGLWLAASVKFLLPFSILIAAGGRIASVVRPAPVQPAISAVVQQVGEPFGLPESTPAFSATPTQRSTNLSEVMPRLVFFVWLAGAVSVLTLWYSRWRRISVAIDSAKPVSDGRESRSLERCTRRLGLEDSEIQMMAASASLEPGIIGIVRPVLLLPSGMSSRLTDDQLDAIITHELCHVRRRDNLLSAVHMVVEGIFWFHPLVWWLGARLVDERERACDAEVLRLGSEPETYAEGILKVCEFYIHSPLLCASGITSSNLKRRVEEIMSVRLGGDLGFAGKTLLVGSAVLSVTIPVCIGIVNASPAGLQTASGPSFEVASIKPNKSGELRSNSRNMPGGGYAATNMTLFDLILNAYPGPEYLLSGGPDWIKRDRFDVDAKAEAGAILSGTAPKTRWRMTNQMLQRLLEARFKLRIRREVREAPIYEMTIANSGSKLKKAAEDCDNTPSGCHGFNGGPRGLFGRSIDMDDLAWELSDRTGRLVRDKTGLSGLYDMELHWTPEQLRGMTPETPSPEVQRREPGVIDPFGPNLLTALQEQLGLRLEAQKGPVEYLIIESVQPLIENGEAEQSTPPTPAAFDAASVKPSNSVDNSSSWNEGKGRVTFSNAKLKDIVVAGLQIRDYQLSGPGWIDSERFDIVAKAEDGAPDSQLKPMLLTLLRDRFKMVFHKESRELPIYALLLTPGGHKLKRPEDQALSVSGSSVGGGAGAGSGGMRPSGGPPMHTMSSTGTLTNFAAMLSRSMDRPVIDMTGLEGRFQMRLAFADGNSSAGSLEPAGPSIFTALQEQLGLKLEARKGPVDIFIIDRIERPTPN